MWIDHYPRHEEDPFVVQVTMDDMRRLNRVSSHKALRGELDLLSDEAKLWTFSSGALQDTRRRWDNPEPTEQPDPEPLPTSKRQVGGDHYTKHEFDPWKIIDTYGLDFYEGCALKYLLRHKNKGGVEDLKKLAHYVERLIEKHS